MRSNIHQRVGEKKQKSLMSEWGFWKCSITEYFLVSAGLTSDTCLKMHSLQAIAEIVSVDCCLSFNSLHRFIILGHYHKACWSLRLCSKLVPNSGEMIHSEFLCRGIFNSLKCQVSSFRPALCLLSFTERTVCLGKRFQGHLSFFSSNQICNPVPRVMIYGKVVCV